MMKTVAEELKRFLDALSEGQGTYSEEDIAAVLDWALKACEAGPETTDGALLEAVVQGTFCLRVEEGHVQFKLTDKGREVADLLPHRKH
jgi:hypothetical protein